MTPASEWVVLALIGATLVLLHLTGLVYLRRVRRNAIAEVRGVLAAGRASTGGRVTVDVYRYRRLSVPMIIELADLEGFDRAGEEHLTNYLGLKFVRRQGWGPPLRDRSES